MCIGDIACIGITEPGIQSRQFAPRLGEIRLQFDRTFQGLERVGVAALGK